MRGHTWPRQRLAAIRPTRNFRCRWFNGDRRCRMASAVPVSERVPPADARGKELAPVARRGQLLGRGARDRAGRRGRVERRGHRVSSERKEHCGIFSLKVARTWSLRRHPLTRSSRQRSGRPVAGLTGGQPRPAEVLAPIRRWRASFPRSRSGPSFGTASPAARRPGAGCLLVGRATTPDPLPGSPVDRANRYQ